METNAFSPEAKEETSSLHPVNETPFTMNEAAAGGVAAQQSPQTSASVATVPTEAKISQSTIAFLERIEERMANLVNDRLKKFEDRLGSLEQERSETTSLLTQILEHVSHTSSRAPIQVHRPQEEQFVTPGIVRSTPVSTTPTAEGITDTVLSVSARGDIDVEPATAKKLDRLCKGLNLGSYGNGPTQNATPTPRSPRNRGDDFTRMADKPQPFKGGNVSAEKTVEWIQSMNQFLHLKEGVSAEHQATLAASYLKDEAALWYHAWRQSRSSRGIVQPITWDELLRALLRKQKCYRLEDQARRDLMSLNPCSTTEDIEKFLKRVERLCLLCFGMDEKVKIERVYDLTSTIPFIYVKTQKHRESYQSVDEMLEALYTLVDIQQEARRQETGKSGHRGTRPQLAALSADEHINALAAMSLSRSAQGRLAKLSGAGPPVRGTAQAAASSIGLCFGCGKTGHLAKSSDCPESARRDAQDPEYLKNRQARFEAFQASKTGRLWRKK
jgi:hypothetical protein